MLRRRHKKSRGGCLQCKQRHVKCDEGQPTCLLCSMSGRICSYATQASPASPTTSGSSSHKRRKSPDENHSQNDVTMPDITPLTTASLSKTNSSNNINTDSAAPDDNTLNLTHMELLIHLTTNKDMFSLGDVLEEHSSWLSLVLSTGLNSAYLLYQLIAFSARHLAFLHPSRSEPYLHQAVTLQTRAVSLFNASGIQVDRSNCVAVLLFSTVLGHHLLADTLGQREPGGLEAFIARYVQCADVERGIYTVVITARPVLMESELETILSRSSEFTSRRPRGEHCQRAWELVDHTDRLSDIEKAACRRAIQYLQIGFDALFSPADKEHGVQYQMLFLWTVLVPAEFTGLLAACRAEALVILAYYALLLGYGREIWQVRDAGDYVLRITGEYLGAEWDFWLEYPRNEMDRILNRGG